MAAKQKLLEVLQNGEDVRVETKCSGWVSDEKPVVCSELRHIFISVLITPEGLPFQSLKLWFEKRYDLVTSVWQIEELRDVSRRDQVKKNLNAADVGTLVNALRSKALVLDTLPTVDYSHEIRLEGANRLGLVFDLDAFTVHGF